MGVWWSGQSQQTVFKSSFLPRGRLKLSGITVKAKFSIKYANTVGTCLQQDESAVETRYQSIQNVDEDIVHASTKVLDK